MAMARLVNNNTVNAVVAEGPATASPMTACPPNSVAIAAVAMKDRSMSARSACPSSKASQSATATPSSATSKPVEASASQLGSRPSGITRIALPSAKNRVATRTNRTTGTGWAGRSTAVTMAPSDGTETAANITQCPARSGPDTLPARAAPVNATAATAQTSTISRTRPRPVSPGRDSSASTANQKMPGNATR